MDLEVVEVQVAYRYGRPGPRMLPTPEWEAYRDAGLYAAAGGEVSISQATLDFDEIVDDDPVADVSLLGGRIAEAVASGVRAARRPLLVGGNCTGVPGMVGGLQQGHGPLTRIGLVWIDAHADFNTPRTSTDGLLGGMPVATVAGLCQPRWRKATGIAVPIPADRILMVDVRRMSEAERTIVEASDVAVVAIDSPGLGPAVERLAAETDLLYVHVDLDVLDPVLVPAHFAREPGGPSVGQLLGALEAMFATRRVGAFALVSLYAAAPEGDKSVAAALSILRPALELWGRAAISDGDALSTGAGRGNR
jgi:arginase